MGFEDNEAADSLAKKGTLIQQKHKRVIFPKEKIKSLNKLSHLEFIYKMK